MVEALSHIIIGTGFKSRYYSLLTFIFSTSCIQLRCSSCYKLRIVRNLLGIYPASDY